jgi:hypothetical protein
MKTKDHKGICRGTSTETATRNETEDRRNVTALERLWALWRTAGDDDPELAQTLAEAPQIVRDRFLKDRSLGRISS